jgi:hypothetical protein
MHRRKAIVTAAVLAGLLSPIAVQSPALAAQKCQFSLTSDPAPTGGRSDVCRSWTATDGGKHRGSVWGELKDLHSDYHSVLLQESRDGRVKTVGRTSNDYPGRTARVSYSYQNVGKLHHRLCLVNYAQTGPAVYCTGWW